MKSGVGAGRKTTAVSNSTVSQTTGGRGGSAAQRTAVGSGSRPGTKSTYPIGSSNPSSSQMIRPKNVIGGTKYKG